MMTVSATWMTLMACGPSCVDESGSLRRQPVVAGRFSRPLLEGAGKVGRIGIAQTLGDLFDGQRSILDQFDGVAFARFIQQLLKA